MNVATETDITKLRLLAAAQDAELRRLGGVLREMSAELARLKGVPSSGELALLDAKLNDRKSPGTPVPKGRGRTKRSRQQTEPARPMKSAEQRCLLEGDALTCETCGESQQEMVGQTEDSEMVDVVDVTYVLKQVRRQKYRCRCGTITTAPGPARTRPGGRYSLEFGLKVAIDKYVHHLPLERQSRMMRSAGLGIGSNTLWDQVEAIAALCEPTWEAIGREALRSGIIGLDQTGWPNLDAKTRKKWQMWSITTARLVFHTIRDDKSAATFEQLVGDYCGYIVCDDLSTHRAGARGSPDIVLVGCWAHIYRRFEEASGDFPEAEYAMRLISLLYSIDANSAPDELAANRSFWSRLVLDELYRWLTTVPVLTTTSLGRTIKHTLKNKERLWLLADDPYVWLDNNPTERSLRGPVVGRRNHFGSKSRAGTKAASILYSLVETAKLNGIEPIDYVRAVATAAQQTPGAVTMPADLTVS